MVNGEWWMVDGGWRMVDGIDGCRERFETVPYRSLPFPAWI